MRPPTPSPTARLAGLGLVTLAGCQSPPEIRYETEHLRIGTGFDEPLCQGDLDHFELVISSVESELATTLDKPVKLYIWGLDWEAESEQWCGRDYPAGCFSGRRIYTSDWAVDHELVHAVVSTIGNPASFWDEGAAEALQSRRTIFGDSAPLDNLGLSSPELSYLTAGHFSRWLIETRGADLYRLLLSAGGGVRSAFENTYDMSLEEAEAEFFDEAPYSYGAFVACEHPELEQVDAATWAETITIDCANGDVRGGQFGMGALRVMTITTRGFYELSTDGDFGVIGRCGDEDIALQPLEGDPSLGHLPPVTSGFQQQYFRAFSSGEPLILDLAPGRYELSVGFGEHETRDAEVLVRPAPGPIPQVPETGP